MLANPSAEEGRPRAHSSPEVIATCSPNLGENRPNDYREGILTNVKNNTPVDRRDN